MNIVWGIILCIVVAVLIFTYGRYQYIKGCRDAFNEAARMLNERIEEVKGETK